MKIPFWNLKMIVPFVVSMECFNPSRYFLSEVHMFTYHVTNAIAMPCLLWPQERHKDTSLGMLSLSTFFYSAHSNCVEVFTIQWIRRKEWCSESVHSLNWKKTLSLPLSSFHIHHFRTLKKAAVQQCWIFRCDSFTRFGVWEGESEGFKNKYIRYMASDSI